MESELAQAESSNIDEQSGREGEADELAFVSRFVGGAVVRELDPILATDTRPYDLLRLF